MKSFISISFAALITCFSNAYAECPDTISHDEARMIANGEKHSFLISQYEPIGNMKDMVVKKGLSSLYTVPKLTEQKADTGDRWLCSYSYTGKVTKGKADRVWNFSISIPKHTSEIK